MARTVQQIVEDLLGKKDMQIASLTAALEDATEKADALQKALDEMTAQSQSWQHDAQGLEKVVASLEKASTRQMQPA